MAPKSEYSTVRETGSFETLVTPFIGLKSRIKITLDVMLVPFDERFGGVINRFKEHSRYLKECAKVANFKVERDRYEDLKRNLQLLVDAQQQKRVDLNAMVQTGHVLRDALMGTRANIEEILKEESKSLSVSRELEERASANFQERIRELDGSPRDSVESEKNRRMATSSTNGPGQPPYSRFYVQQGESSIDIVGANPGKRRMESEYDHAIILKHSAPASTTNSTPSTLTRQRNPPRNTIMGSSGTPNNPSGALPLISRVDGRFLLDCGEIEYLEQYVLAGISLPCSDFVFEATYPRKEIDIYLSGHGKPGLYDVGEFLKSRKMVL